MHRIEVWSILKMMRMLYARYDESRSEAHDLEIRAARFRRTSGR